MRSFSLWFLIGALASAGASAQPSSDADPLPTRSGTPNGSDSCASATPITGAGTYDFNNSAATTDGLAHGACFFASQAQIARDIWYRWTATCTGPVTLTTCGATTVDTKVAVYAPGAPCPPTDQYLIRCDDNSCDTNRNNVTFLAIAGQRYLIRLGSYPVGGGEGIGGVGTFTISCVEQETLCSSTDDLLCQNPGTANVYNSSQSFRCADDFTARATGVVTSLCFWGTTTSDEKFVVRYYRNFANKPGSLLAAYTQGVDLAIAARRPTGAANPGGVEVEYAVHHPPLPVDEGERYWVEIRNEGSGLWQWSESQSGGGRSLQDFTLADSYDNAVQRPNLGLCVGFESFCSTDINNDRVTDFADLNALLVNFGFACD